MKMYKPKAVHIRDNFYAVEESGWIPVNKDGDYIGPGNNIIRNDPDKDNYVVVKGVPLHRAILLTFLETDNDPNNMVVNHINGKKSDNRLENLEWTTYSGNSLHAYKNGLRLDNRKILVKNIETNEVKVFYSLQECGRYFNVNAGSIYQYINRPKTNPYRSLYDIIYDGQNWSGFTIDDLIYVDEVSGSKPILAVSDDATKRSFIFPNSRTAAAMFESNPTTIRWYTCKNGKKGRENSYKGYRWFYLRDYFKQNKTIEDRKGFVDNLGVEKSVTEYNQNPELRKPAKLKVTNLKTGDSEIWNSLNDYCYSKGIKKNSLERRLWRNANIVNGQLFEYINKTKQYVK